MYPDHDLDRNLGLHRNPDNFAPYEALDTYLFKRGSQDIEDANIKSSQEIRYVNRYYCSICIHTLSISKGILKFCN